MWQCVSVRIFIWTSVCWYECVCVWFHAHVCVCLEALNVAVSLEWGEQDVDQPQADKEHGCEHFGSPRASQLSTDVGSAPVHERSHADEGEDGEECDWEGQAAWLHTKFTPFRLVVDGGDGPCHTDAQEHIHRIAARHVPDRRIGILVLDRSHFTGEGVWRKK